MIITMDEVVKRTQVLLDDPTGSQFDSGYLAGIINQRYDDMVIELDELELSYEEVVVVVNPFAAGTTDTSALEGDGQQLAAIMLPEKVEWKRVGEDDEQYREAFKRDILPDVKPGTVEGIGFYEWRGGVIYLTPSSIDVVLRVRHQAMSTNLVDPTDKVLRGVTNVLAYKAAELASALRGGDGGTKLALRYQAMGREAMENFEVLATKNAQKQMRRPGRFSRRGRRRGIYVAR